jgi:hypothetical protein
MKTIARVLLLAMIPAFAACDDDSSGPDLDVEGTYQLELVNNQPLPFVLDQQGTTFLAELTSAAITLNANGSFTDVATIRTTDNGVVTTESQPDGGIYTQNNSVVSLHYQGGGIINATVNGNTLTITGPGATFVFRK